MESKKDTMIEMEEFIPNPVITYSQYLSNIWNHGLVDDVTLKFRETVKLKLEACFNDLGLEKNYAAIPVGSIRNLADNKSDIDTVLFLNNEIFPYWNNLHDKALKFKNANIDIVAKGYMFTECNYTGTKSIADLIFALMICPDQYIAGDIQAIKKLRQVAVNILEKNKKLWKDLDRKLVRNVSTWHIDKSPVGCYSNKGIKGEGRLTRIRRVELAAEGSKEIIEQWLSFRENLKKFPTEVMMKAVRANVFNTLKFSHSQGGLA